MARGRPAARSDWALARLRAASSWRSTARLCRGRKRDGGPPKEASENEPCRPGAEPSGGESEGPAFEGELEITDTRQALAAAIDDLRIQDVACQQELVMRERG